MKYFVRVYADDGEGWSGGWGEFHIPDALEPFRGDIAEMSGAFFQAFRKAEADVIGKAQAKLVLDPPSVTQ